MNATLRELASCLRDRQDEIIERWRRACAADGLEVVSRLTREEFRNQIPGAIDALCRALTAAGRDGATDAIRTEVAKHGHDRWKQGFSLQQLIRDWGNLNRVLIGLFEDFLRDRCPPNAPERAQAWDRLAAFMTDATSSSVSRFDELRRAEAASLARDLAAVRDQFDRLTETRGHLLREAAHDIRGGLSAIEGAAAVLELSRDGNESFAEMLAVLDRGVQSVKQMLDSLLDLSRLESGADRVELLSVNIAEVLGQLAEEFDPVASSKGVTLRAEGPPELLVRADPDKVRRIAQNLLVNALQHTTSGEVRLAWMPGPARWTLRVSDTGPGIQDVLGSPVAQEMRDDDRAGAAADPSAPGTQRGEGIGLTIVKRLCDLLDAGIALESELGQGTTFTVQFPLGFEEQ